MEKVWFDAVRNKLCLCCFHENYTNNVITNVSLSLKLQRKQNTDIRQSITGTYEPIAVKHHTQTCLMKILLGLYNKNKLHLMKTPLKTFSRLFLIILAFTNDTPVTYSNNITSLQYCTLLTINSMACICSWYNVHSDWLILGQYSPLISMGQLQAHKTKAKRHNYNKQFINLKHLLLTGKSLSSAYWPR